MVRCQDTTSDRHDHTQPHPWALPRPPTAGYGPVALPTGGFGCAPLQCKSIEPYAGVLLAPQLVAIGSGQYGLQFNVSLGVNPLTIPTLVNFDGEASASQISTPTDSFNL